MDGTHYKVMSIIRGTTVDGPGFRTAIYLSGCTHQCPGCHNPQSWNPDNGDAMTIEEIMEIVREEDFDVTLSGGDPLYNPEMTKTLIEAIKADIEALKDPDLLFRGSSNQRLIDIRPSLTNGNIVVYKS